MALCTIDTIREAEELAQKELLDAQLESEARIAQALSKADEIIQEAVSNAQMRIENKADRAKKESDEIIVCARNRAVLEADELKSESCKKQELVNKRIIELLT